MRGALRARLLEDVAIAALVDERVTWLTRPQGEALPAVTLQLISGVHPQHLEGFEKQEARVQLDAWAETTLEAATIVTAAKEALAPGGVHEEVQFSRMFFEGEGDFAERQGDTTIYRVTIDLIFDHEPAEGGPQS